MEEVPSQNLSSRGNEQSITPNNNSLIKKLTVSLFILVVILVIGKSSFFVKPTEKFPITQTENSLATTSGSIKSASVNIYDDNDWKYYVSRNGIISTQGAKVDADVQTFHEIGYGWARDKNMVYQSGYSQTFLDPSTVRILSPRYAVDKSGVWALDDANYKIGADQATFSLLGSTFKEIEWGYAKDKNNVYINGEKILNADAESFMLLSNPDASFSGYAKDRHNIYYIDNIIPNVDIRSFILLGNSYAKDKNNVYYEGKVVKDADVNTFVLVGRYAKDNKHVFLGSHMLHIEIVPATFEVLIGDHYRWVIKDSERVYFQDYQGYRDYEPTSRLLMGVDAPTFQFVGPCFSGGFTAYYKDKDHVYTESSSIESGPVKAIEIIDASSFEYFGYYSSSGLYSSSRHDISYAKDKNNVYEGCSKIFARADADTFINLGGGYAKDKDEVFFFATVVIGADVPTFKYIGERYAIDKNHVYFNGEVLKKADPVTFTLVKGPDPSNLGQIDEYAIDKNYVYKGYRIIDGVNPENCKSETIENCEPYSI